MNPIKPFEQTQRLDYAYDGTAYFPPAPPVITRNYDGSGPSIKSVQLQTQGQGSIITVAFRNGATLVREGRTTNAPIFTDYTTDSWFIDELRQWAISYYFRHGNVGRSGPGFMLPDVLSG